jgi:phosphoribosylaminoimidazole carboxylase
MEACDIDQFEMHLRAILDLPCPQPKMKVNTAIMINILGKNSMSETKEFLFKSMEIPSSGVHWYGKNECRKGRKMGHVTITADNFNELINKVETLGISSNVHKLLKKGPQVGIIMGSDSDLSVMKEAAVILDNFGITYELTIVSAHRTPTRLYTYAQSSIERGLQVIIAGAGGAAHLPGMVAALTSLPVIGVPIKTSILNGEDSLLSIVQMPKGIPVATVAINNASNAGLLAARILACSYNNMNRELLLKMDAFMLQQEEEVLKKAARLESIGYEEYLK